MNRYMVIIETDNIGEYISTAEYLGDWVIQYEEMYTEEEQLELDFSTTTSTLP